MKSYRPADAGMAALRKRNTSPRTTLRFWIPNCLQVCMIKFCCVCASSTAVTCLAPRDTNSSPIEPVPAKRSSIRLSSKSRRLFKRLNRLSLAKSVVGRAVIFLGGDNRRPLYLPLIIRITLFFLRGPQRSYAALGNAEAPSALMTTESSVNARGCRTHR